MKCIIAEKPSVARDLARIVGANQKREGYIEGNGYTVTWAFGHLVGLAMPDAYGIEGKGAQTLPILPNPFQLTVRTTIKGKERVDDPGALKQLKVIEECFKKADSIIVATDAGREGELIFRYLYDYLQCDTPFERLWISSLTDKAIREGMASLRPGKEYDHLYHAGKARSEADWIVGINASRALSIAAACGGYSLGRVQTPTLALICERYLEAEKFQSKPFYRILATLSIDSETKITIKSQERFDAKEQAHQAMAHLAQASQLTATEVTRWETEEQPPLPYDLTTLQREANRKYGYSAEQTLAAAQALYERKVTTYPRTGSQYITEDIFDTVPALIQSLHSSPELGAYAQTLDMNALTRRCVDANRVTDHHALLVTGETPKDLTQELTVIYDMIARRMLQAFAPPAQCVKLKATLQAEGLTFALAAKRYADPGWKSLEQSQNDDDELQDEQQEQELAQLPDLTQESQYPVGNLAIAEGKTKPKPLFTEASLLSAMEHASAALEDKLQKEVLKQIGIGTPATRASIIETLIKREYIQRQKKKLIPTKKGLAVYDIVREMHIANPSLTASWEIDLARIEQGEMNPEQFSKAIGEYAHTVCQQLLQAKIESQDQLATCPCCKQQTVRIFPKIAKCTAQGCEFKLFRSILGTTLTERQVEDLLTKGKTKPIPKLVGKSGTPFTAAIALAEDGTTKLIFTDTPAKGKAKKK